MTNNSATEAAAGKADIVGRLNRRAWFIGRWNDTSSPERHIVLETSAVESVVELKEAATEIASLRELIEDYEVVLADKRKIARDIDVAMHGEDGAARQPSLCDLVDPARRLRARAETAERELDASNANHRAMAKQLADLGRERDQARAALKPFAAYSVGAILKDENFDYRIHVCCSMDDQPQFKHFDAARAITGED